MTDRQNVRLELAKALIEKGLASWMISAEHAGYLDKLTDAVMGPEPAAVSTPAVNTAAKEAVVALTATPSPPTMPKLPGGRLPPEGTLGVTKASAPQSTNASK